MEKLYFIVGVFLFTAGCYNKIVEEGDKLYNEGRYSEAVRYYEKYIQLKKKLKSTKEEELLYKIATIYNLHLYSCQDSKRYFELLVKSFPNSKYKEEAVFRSIFCPNYIYPKHKKYILGDSQSYGKNAQEVIRINKKSFSEIDFISEVYAGKKLLSKTNKRYLIKEMDIFEKSSTNQQLLLKYPLEKNMRFEYNNTSITIEKVGKVEVKAGIFTNCIAVKNLIKGSDIGNIYYMAPEIGKILISSFYEGKETRIMELISYE